MHGLHDLQRLEKQLDPFGRRTVLEKAGVVLQEHDKQMCVRLENAVDRIEQKLHAAPQLVGLRLQDELLAFVFALVQFVHAPRVARVLGDLEENDERERLLCGG